MYSKKYTFAGLTIEMTGETEIENSEPCLPFISDCPADYKIGITEGALPCQTGEPIFEKRNHRCYKTADGYAYYSSFDRYPDPGRRDYACFIPCENGGMLTVDFDGGLWDTMVLDALNIPAILINRKSELMLHASCIEYKGKAILFTAPKQTGKSTQAELWHRYRNAGIINGDRIAVGMKSGVVTAYGTPYRGSSDTGKNAILPVAAVVTLQKAENNSIKKLSETEAFLALMNGATVDSEIPEIAEKATDVAALLCGRVPFYHLACTPDERAVDTLYNEIKTVFDEG